MNGPHQNIYAGRAVLVLEDGRVAGLGTHEELLATNQTYREIAESQLSVEAGA